MNFWGLTSPSQVKAQAKYDKNHTIRLSLKLNLRTDLDVIQWLRGQASMQGAVKRLIREEIARVKDADGPTVHRSAISPDTHTDGSTDA